MKPRLCKWYIIDTTHPSYASVRNQLGNAHRKTWPLNLLSVVPNIAGNQSVIKVDFGADTVIKPAPPILVAEFDKDTHWQLQDLMQTPDWRNITVE